MGITRRTVTTGFALGMAMPAVLRSARGQAASIKIGMVLPVTGAAADSGKYSSAGAKLALDRVNKSGGVLSRQVEIVTEDDQTTNPGAVLAFSKLATHDRGHAQDNAARSRRTWLASSGFGRRQEEDDIGPGAFFEAGSGKANIDKGKKHDCAIQIAVEKLALHPRWHLNGDPRRKAYDHCPPSRDAA